MSRASSPAPSTPKGSMMKSSSSRNSLQSDDESVTSAATKANRRVEVMLKREEKRQMDEAQFTYKPTLFTQRSPSAQRMHRERGMEGEQENRFEKLYVDAVKRQITGKIIQQVSNDVSFDRDLTFTPKLSKKGASGSRAASRERLGISRSRSGYSSDASSVGDASSPYSTVSGVRRSRSRSVSASQANSPSSECSFTPQITKKAHRTAERRSVNSGVESYFSDEPLSSRLHRQAAILQEKAAQRREEHAQLAMQECTFTPVLHASKSAQYLSEREEEGHEGQEDVALRLWRRDEARKEKLEQRKLELNQQELAKLTFQPIVKNLPLSYQKHSSSRASSRASSPSRSTDVVERLLTPVAPSRRTLQAENEAHVDLTFQPKLVAKRALSPSAMQESADFTSVHEKLFVIGVNKQRAKDTEAERQRAELSSEHSFVPSLSANTLAHAAAARHRNNSSSNNSGRNDDEENGSVISANSAASVGSVFDRLATQDKISKERLQRIQQEASVGHTFQPTISEKSKELQACRATHAPIYERLQEKALRTAEEVEQKRLHLEQQREAKELAELRNPQLSRRSLEIVQQQRRSGEKKKKQKTKRPSAEHTNNNVSDLDTDDHSHKNDSDNEDDNYHGNDNSIIDSGNNSDDDNDNRSGESVFSRLSEQQTSSSHRRRSLVAREHLLGKDDPRSRCLSLDEYDTSFNNNQRNHINTVNASSTNTNTDDDNADKQCRRDAFVRASPLRTLSGRDLSQLVQRLAQPYPRERKNNNDNADDANNDANNDSNNNNNTNAHPHSKPALLLSEAQREAAAARLHNKPTKAFLLMTNDSLRSEEQLKQVAANRRTPSPMSGAQRQRLFERLAAGEKRNSDDDNHTNDNHSHSEEKQQTPVRRSRLPSPAPNNRTSDTIIVQKSTTLNAAVVRRRSAQGSEKDDDHNNNHDNNSDNESVGSVRSVHSTSSLKLSASSSKTMKASTTTNIDKNASGEPLATLSTAGTARNSSSSTNTQLPIASNSGRSATPVKKPVTATATVTRRTGISSSSNNSSRNATPTKLRSTTNSSTNTNTVKSNSTTIARKETAAKAAETEVELGEAESKTNAATAIVIDDIKTNASSLKDSSTNNSSNTDSANTGSTNAENSSNVTANNSQDLRRRLSGIPQRVVTNPTNNTTSNSNTTTNISSNSRSVTPSRPSLIPRSSSSANSSANNSRSNSRSSTPQKQLPVSSTNTNPANNAHNSNSINTASNTNRAATPNKTVTKTSITNSNTVKSSSNSSPNTAANNATNKSPSSQAQLLRKSSADRLMSSLARKPSHSRLLHPNTNTNTNTIPYNSNNSSNVSSKSRPSAVVQYEWAGKQQNTGKRPTDDFEAKLQASLAMLKPLDDLLLDTNSSSNNSTGNSGSVTPAMAPSK